MKAQTYTILLTIEDAMPPSAKDIEDVLVDVFEKTDAITTVSVVFGNVALMHPALVRKHTGIHSEYANK